MEQMATNLFNNVASLAIGPRHYVHEFQKGYDVVCLPLKSQALAQDIGFVTSQTMILSTGGNMSAHIAQKSPCSTTVEAGKSYFWCACGLSKTQPFCDGSHKGSEFVPIKWEATVSQTVYFCGCKQSKGPPLCDGSHKNL